MKERLWGVLDELIALFENAPRMGAEKDEPEGVRYIQISDTLAHEFSEVLRKYVVAVGFKNGET